MIRAEILGVFRFRVLGFVFVLNALFRLQVLSEPLLGKLVRRSLLLRFTFSPVTTRHDSSNLPLHLPSLGVAALLLAKAST